jgi:EAL domain-containing protein (putative c-di-GMP-specific phosphodiesterase class I)
VTAIVEIAKVLKLKVVAQRRVEKQVQKEFLKQLDCYYLEVICSIGLYVNRNG